MKRLCVCVCNCMFIHVYVCVCVCVHKCVYIHICVYMRAHKHKYVVSTSAWALVRTDMILVSSINNFECSSIHQYQCMRKIRSQAQTRTCLSMDSKVIFCAHMFVNICLWTSISYDTSHSLQILVLDSSWKVSGAQTLLWDPEPDCRNLVVKQLPRWLGKAYVERSH